LRPMQELRSYRGVVSRPWKERASSVQDTVEYFRPLHVFLVHLVEFAECEAFVHQEALQRPTCIGQFGVRRGNAELIWKRKAQNGEHHTQITSTVDSRQRTRIRRVSQPVIPTPKRQSACAATSLSILSFLPEIGQK
jgi:hypothetical protein